MGVSSQHATSHATPAGRPGSRPAGVGSWALALSATAFAAVVATSFFGFAEHLNVALLDANSGSSWSHGVVDALLVGAAAAGVIGVWRSPRKKRLWIVAAVIFLLLAIDELSPLHVHVDQLIWGKMLYAPILLVLSLCLWRLAAGTGQSAAIYVGLAMLLVSFAFHVFGPLVESALGWSSNSWGYQVKGVLKQGTELAGWLLVVPALWQSVRGVPETSQA
jgi:hypothetical protein